MVELAIEIEGVSVRRGTTLALKDLSLRIPRGAIHAVVGPNGGGKSTLLAALSGGAPFEGRIGMHLEPGPRRRVAFVPQRFKTDQSLPLRADEFLGLFLQRRPVALGLSSAVRARVAASLERVGLAEAVGKMIFELSGGQLQRLLLAQAIDPPPQILLLDEPTTGLDPEALELLEKTALALREDHGTTLVWVTHDLAQVHRVADQVTVLRQTAAASGTPAEVFGDAAAGLGRWRALVG